ncbi:MAG TPA: PIN domain-containing protein [archaeon]|nr:PIN domain-containing protein [archaeon]
MLFVTDTHALIWFLTMPEKLGLLAKKAFEEAEEGKATIIIPTIVLAELLYLLEKKKANKDFGKIVEKVEKSSNYTVASLDMEVLKRVEIIKNIPELHDRIITATALIFNAKIITKDSQIAKSKNVGVVW